jgi:monoamine oxidase
MIAYLLQKKGIDVLILEANNTHWWTDRNSNWYNRATMEMGATWFSKPISIPC